MTLAAAVTRRGRGRRGRARDLRPRLHRGGHVDGVLRRPPGRGEQHRDRHPGGDRRAHRGARGRRRLEPGLLARAIDEGLRAARLTDGDVDPTAGTAIRLAGYDADFAAVAAEGAPLTLVVQPVPGWRALRFDPASRRVFVPVGVEIDLGATAKALASDLAATAGLAAMGGGGVPVSLGGDIALAGRPPHGGWTVAVSDDSNDPVGSAQESVTLQGGGVASSSTRVRRRLATVVADTCVDANIASTAAIVRGAAAVDWLAALRLPARLVDGDRHVVRSGGSPAPAQAG